MERIPKIAMEEPTSHVRPHSCGTPFAAAGVDDLKPSLVLGSIRRGVKATELATFSDESRIEYLIDMARDLERNGDAPCIKFYRNAEGMILGITLCAELSNETKLALAEV